MRSISATLANELAAIGLAVFALCLGPAWAQQAPQDRTGTGVISDQKKSKANDIKSVPTPQRPRTGNAGGTVDDVVVDGRIITGENYNSAKKPAHPDSKNSIKSSQTPPKAPAGGTGGASDDVIVDGRIITAENYDSAKKSTRPDSKKALKPDDPSSRKSTGSAK